MSQARHRNVAGGSDEPQMLRIGDRRIPDGGEMAVARVTMEFLGTAAPASALAAPEEAVVAFLRLAAAELCGVGLAGGKRYLPEHTRYFDDGGRTDEGGFRIGESPSAVVRRGVSNGEEMIGAVDHHEWWDGELEGGPLGIAVLVEVRRTTFGGRPNPLTFRARLTLTADAGAIPAVADAFRAAFGRPASPQPGSPRG
jgi:hypothetical protein